LLQTNLSLKGALDPFSTADLAGEVATLYNLLKVSEQFSGCNNNPPQEGVLRSRPPLLSRVFFFFDDERSQRQITEAERG